MADIAIETCSGEQVLDYLDKLARLRIVVFREYPYLYDGSIRYEERYLSAYANSPNSFFVVVRDGGRIIGVSTAIPLVEAEDAFQKPFLDKGIDILSVVYFGESVLLPEYRGMGLGHRFFTERETFSHNFGAKITAFCAVVRSEAHHSRPHSYRSHDSFWRQRGYYQQSGMNVRYRWQDVGDSIETEKNMVFWTKSWL